MLYLELDSTMGRRGRERQKVKLIDSPPPLSFFWTVANPLETNFFLCLNFRCCKNQDGPIIFTKITLTTRPLKGTQKNRKLSCINYTALHNACMSRKFIHWRGSSTETLNMEIIAVRVNGDIN